MKDEDIRAARSAAHAGEDSLVPLGEEHPSTENLAPPPTSLVFGQTVTSSVGAGYDLRAVPGMYDGRPERYFDSDRDPRKAHHVGDHQFTREVQLHEILSTLARYIYIYI